MKQESKVYTKVAIFKTPSQRDALKVLFNIFDNGNVIRSTYIVQNEKGAALVVHHEGWTI